MRILLLRDARPGHYNQSEGLAAALGRRRPVEVARLAVAPRRLLKGHALRWLAQSGLPAGPLFRATHGLDPARLAAPDLIVSAGSDTLVANVLLARRFSVPNVFIGSLRGMPPQDFTAVLTIYPSLADGDRVILAAKPTPVDPDRLPPPRPLRSPVDLAGATVAVLVGGPTPNHLWAAEDWARLADRLVTAAAALGARLRLTTSPRTPPEAAAALGRLAGHPAVDTVALYGAAQASPLDHFFSADAIIVTDDSATMVFEAVAARRPVVVLGAPQRRPARDDEAFDALAAAGRIARLGVADLGPERLAAALAEAMPGADHPWDTLLEGLRPPLARAGLAI